MAGAGSANSHISLARSGARSESIPPHFGARGPLVDWQPQIVQFSCWGPGMFKWRPSLGRSQGKQTRSWLDEGAALQTHNPLGHCLGDGWDSPGVLCVYSPLHR